MRYVHTEEVDQQRVEFPRRLSDSGNSEWFWWTGRGGLSWNGVKIISKYGLEVDFQTFWDAIICKTTFLIANGLFITNYSKRHATAPLRHHYYTNHPLRMYELDHNSTSYLQAPTDATTHATPHYWYDPQTTTDINVNHSLFKCQLTQHTHQNLSHHSST